MKAKADCQIIVRLTVHGNVIFIMCVKKDTRKIKIILLFITCLLNFHISLLIKDSRSLQGVM